jgi:hypothetical protein
MTKIKKSSLKNLHKVKINFKMIKKNQILILLKTTTKTLKESEKFVNTIRKYSKTAKRKVIYKNKEIK